MSKEKKPSEKEKNKTTRPVGKPETATGPAVGNLPLPNDPPKPADKKKKQ